MTVAVGERGAPATVHLRNTAHELQVAPLAPHAVPGLPAGLAPSGAACGAHVVICYSIYIYIYVAGTFRVYVSNRPGWATPEEVARGTPDPRNRSGKPPMSWPETPPQGGGPAEHSIGVVGNSPQGGDPGDHSNEVVWGAPKDTVRINPQGGGLGGSMVTSREVGPVEHSNEMVRGSPKEPPHSPHPPQRGPLNTSRMASGDL